MQIVVFTLGNERFALESKIVDGIEKTLSITRVPTAPNYMVGLANLRGIIIPVIDLKLYLNIEKAKNEENVIIIESGEERIGIIVDEVNEVIEITDDMIEMVIDNTGYVKGVINFSDYIVTLLEGEELTSIWEG